MRTLIVMSSDVKLNLFCSLEYAYFFFYSLVRGSYIRRTTARLPAGSKPPPLSTAAELALGAVAGALAQICTIPVAVIATRQQIGRSLDAPRSRRPPTDKDLEKGKMSNGSAQPNGKAREEKYDDSFFAVAREIIAEEGVTGLWLGLGPALVLTVNPAITYGMYERVKGITLRAAGGSGAGNMSPWMTFLVGATSKTLATIVRYDFDEHCSICLTKKARTGDISVYHGEGTNSSTFCRHGRSHRVIGDRIACTTNATSFA